MPIPEAKYIWFDGELVPWEDAKVHVLAHAIHYGSAVFEGMRAYSLPTGTAIFRLSEHMQRLLDSAKIYRMPVKYDLADLCEAAKTVVRANGHKECYVRPVAMRGYGEMGVDPRGCPVQTFIATWEWGAYLGAEALQKGIDVCVSSWARMAPNTFPSLAKTAANYANSQLIKMDALENGYAEAIVLDTNGYVAEGSGENLFLVKKGVICTPPLSNSVLGGITRDSVMVLARDLGYEVRESVITREMLYVADELFYSGTAAEITPIRSVDKIVVGSGECGPVTKALQSAFFEVVRGRTADRYGWFTPVG